MISPAIKAFTLFVVGFSLLVAPTEGVIFNETAAALTAAGGPSSFHPLPLCAKPTLRRDWRTLNDAEKAAYISAVQCMFSRPSRTDSPSKSRFEDFQWTHQVLGDEVHGTSQFLPWHRLMIITFEKEMRKECGYKGASPYWDWSKDVANGGTVKTNPIWDPVTGFGGNGVFIADYNGIWGNNTNLPGWKHDSGGGCITDGPFANHTQNIGPGTTNKPHCIIRAHNDNFNKFISYEAVDLLMPIGNFTEFWHELEPLRPTVEKFLGAHGAGHFAGGGTLQDPYSSPGDPVFYLHHANIDRIWWLWQKQNRFRNLFKLNGPAYQFQDSVQVTYDFNMRMLGVAPDATIGSVMDIRNTFGCYDYV